MENEGVGSASKTAVRDLKGGLHGSLIRPGEDEYEAARKVWNGMIDKRPALIVQPLDEGDVVRAVNFAREQGLLLAVF